MPVVLTKKKVDKLLDTIVAEFGPDYVYETPDGSCSYAQMGAPSCLVGHVLYRAGVPVSTLDILDDEVFHPEEDDVSDRRYIISLRDSAYRYQSYYDSEYDIPFAEAAGLELTDEVYSISVLAAVQDLQDLGVPWGVAVERARKWATSPVETRLPLYEWSAEVAKTVTPDDEPEAAD